MGKIQQLQKSMATIHAHREQWCSLLWNKSCVVGSSDISEHMSDPSTFKYILQTAIKMNGGRRHALIDLAVSGWVRCQIRKNRDGK